MSARRDNADGPEDIDAAFAEIVAGLEDETPRWPDDLDPGASTTGSSGTSGPGTAPRATTNPRDWTPTDGPTSLDGGSSGSGKRGEPGEDEEGHFEPGEPPPLPAPRAGTVGGFALIGVGLLLLLVPGLVGTGAAVALPAGLIAISGGICWLLFRLRQGPTQSDDDGAQV